MADQTTAKEDILENGMFLILLGIRISTYARLLWFSTEFYHQFLSENFDVKEHASQVLQGSIVSEQLAKLADGTGI